MVVVPELYEKWKIDKSQQYIHIEPISIIILRFVANRGELRAFVAAAAAANEVLKTFGRLQKSPSTSGVTVNNEASCDMFRVMFSFMTNRAVSMKCLAWFKFYKVKRLQVVFRVLGM